MKKEPEATQPNRGPAAAVRCKACKGDTTTADESGLCAPCRILREGLQEMLDKKKAEPESVPVAPQVEPGSEIEQRIGEWEIRAANRILSPTVTGCQIDETVAYFAMIIRDEFAKQRPEPSPSVGAQVEWPSHKEVNDLNQGTAVGNWVDGWNAALAACKLAYAAALAPTQPSQYWEATSGKMSFPAEATQPQPSAARSEADIMIELSRYLDAGYGFQGNTDNGLYLMALALEKLGFEAAHELRPCGHSRGDYRDPLFGTPEYAGNEKCVGCEMAKSSPPSEELARRIAEARIQGMMEAANIARRYPCRESSFSARADIARAIEAASLSANTGQSGEGK